MKLHGYDDMAMGHCPKVQYTHTHMQTHTYVISAAIAKWYKWHMHINNNTNKKYPLL